MYLRYRYRSRLGWFFWFGPIHVTIRRNLADNHQCFIHEIRLLYLYYGPFILQAPAAEFVLVRSCKQVCRMPTAEMRKLRIAIYNLLRGL